MQGSTYFASSRRIGPDRDVRANSHAGYDGDVFDDGAGMST
jgi:hypothetical protein